MQRGKGLWDGSDLSAMLVHTLRMLPDIPQGHPNNGPIDKTIQRFLYVSAKNFSQYARLRQRFQPFFLFQQYPYLYQTLQYPFSSHAQNILKHDYNHLIHGSTFLNNMTRFSLILLL